MKKEEQFIVKQLQRQDKEVIAQLYDDYADVLYGVILKIVRREDVARDVLQEAFVKIWRKGSSYDPSRGTLFTWMLNIARHTAIDKTRSAAYRREIKIQPLDQLVYNGEEGRTEQHTEHIGLRPLVEELDERYREVIELVYFQGFTQQEVKEQLDIPLGTVKSRLRIALRELKKFFEIPQITVWLVLGQLAADNFFIFM